MIKKMLVTALFLSIVPLTTYAASADDTAPLPGDNTTPRSVKSSYFQGIWIGSWPSANSLIANNVTITIGRKIRENIFDVVYSWEGMTLRNSIIPAGEVRTEGREQEDKFLFQWTNKQGREFEIILKKIRDNEVKARLEKSGPLGPKERPDNETTLHRR
jgi:hypothetical protein